MESVPHGIGVQNRYALFYDEGVDPLEILKQTEEQISKKKTEKPVKGKPTKAASSAPPKKPAESVASKAVKIQEQDNATKPRGKPALQNKTSNSNDFRENDKNIRNRDDNFSGGEAREGSELRRGGRGGGFRGRGGPSRGRGFFSNNDNRNRRVFDRKSGSDKSGVKPVEKREGAGSNNWGDIRSDINQRRDEVGWDDEFEGEAAPRQQELGNSGDEQITEFGKVDEAPKNESLDNSDSKENDQMTEEQIQDTAKEMTLDEWKKEQEAKRVVPKFNLRKPGEGVDDKQWKKGYVLKKKPKEDDEEEDDEDIEDEEYGRRGPQKVLLDIQFNYADSRRGSRGRGRGGRGGPRSGPHDNANRDSPRDDRARDGRGGRPTGSSKMRSGQQAAPRVDDFNDFPSLVNA